MTVATLADPALVEHANAIRGLGKRVVADVIEIGRRLADCKELCGHGNWLPWLKREFGWSEDTAERFIQVSTLSHQIPQVAEFNLPVSSLYLLAARRRPTKPARASSRAPKPARLCRLPRSNESSPTNGRGSKPRPSAGRSARMVDPARFRRPRN
jgi:hypothetical protein